MSVVTQFDLALHGHGELDLTEVDADALEAVLDESHAYRRRFTYYKSSRDWAASLLSERDADASRDVVLIRRAGVPIGMFELVLDNGALTIALLVIIEPLRLAGIGRRAVEALLASAARGGIDTVALGVELANRPARAFWERLGFIETSTVGSGVERIVNCERWLTAGDSAAL